MMMMMMMQLATVASVMMITLQTPPLIRVYKPPRGPAV
jgi:hypothetical protein